MRDKVLTLFSGGKDSIYALQKALKSKGVDLVASISSKSGETQLHAGPELNNELRRTQLNLIGLPHRTIKVGTGRDYLTDLFKGLKRIVDSESVGYLVTGDLWHPYTSGIGDMLAGAVGVEIIRPAREVCPSRNEAVSYMKKVVCSGIESVVLSVRKGNLPKNFVGRQIDSSFIDELERMGIDPAGEGGEYQSLTISAPVMNKRIIIDSYDTQLVDGKNGREQFYRMNIDRFYTEAK